MIFNSSSFSFFLLFFLVMILIASAPYSWADYAKKKEEIRES